MTKKHPAKAQKESKKLRAKGSKRYLNYLRSRASKNKAPEASRKNSKQMSQRTQSYLWETRKNKIRRATSHRNSPAARYSNWDSSKRKSGKEEDQKVVRINKKVLAWPHEIE